MEPDDGGQLLDYKFFCFDGVPKFIQVDQDRYSDHKRNFFTPQWEDLPFSILYPPSGRVVEKPRQLKEMVDVATALSEGFPFVRIDLYECNGIVYFGEFTFHHGGGFEPILPDEWDKKIGSMLTLPESNL